MPKKEASFFDKELVAETVTTLHRERPDLQLFVEELVLRKQVLDPLLYTLDERGKRHYLEVWG